MRTGIKFGLAGLLAIHVALYLRLGDPTWALFTVFVLMIAPYVGAIGEKSFLRAIGTVVGGALGYLLLGSLQQEPVIFIPAVALLVAVCASMFGQSHFPYVFMLTALTSVVVIANGLDAPSTSWQIALIRSEEIVVGIFATLVVSTLVWPRYAREEFRQKTRASFADLADCFDENRLSLTRGVSDEARGRIGGIPLRLTGLRTLLHFGARESPKFRRRVDVYSEIVSRISRIAGSIRTLSDPLPPDPFYYDKIEGELRRVHRAISDSLRNLSHGPEASDAHAGLRAELDTAIDEFERQVHSLRRHPDASQVSSAEALVFGVHALALCEIRDHILRVHELIRDVDAPPKRPSPIKPRHPLSSWLPGIFWIRNGIKAGLAVAISLVFVDWLNPPGGSTMVLGAFVFTFLNPVAPDGQGDRHAFHMLAFYTLLIALASIVLLLASPLLSSYAALCVLLFAALFVWGYTFPIGGGIPVSHQIAMLTIVSAVGLNAQKPVTFDQIEDFFVGLTLGLVVSSIVQRLLWPALPQRSVRDRLAEFVAHCEHLATIGADKFPLKDRVRMALIPAEARQFLSALSDSPGSADDVTKFATYLE
ncbi:MAG: FUSC family protein, partial [Chthoniobacterales bacterium]